MKLLSHFARGGDTIVRATSNNTLLSGFAARHLDGSLAIMVLNKSPGSTFTVNISLTGFAPQAECDRLRLWHSQDAAAHTGSGIHRHCRLQPDQRQRGFRRVHCSSTQPRSFPFSLRSPSLRRSRPSRAAGPATTGQNASFTVIATGQSHAELPVAADGIRELHLDNLERYRQLHRHRDGHVDRELGHRGDER